MNLLVAPYKVEGCVNSSLKDCISYCKSKSFLTVDTETRPREGWFDYKKAGLDPHTSEVVVFQIGDENRQYVIDTRFVDISNSELMDILCSKEYTKLLVNAKFDYKMILSNFGVRLRNFKDLFVREIVLKGARQNYGYSLEKMAKRYLGIRFKKTNQLNLFGVSENSSFIPISKDTRLEFRNIGDNPLTSNQITYCGLDVLLPTRIYPKQLALLKEENLQTCADLEDVFTSSLAEMEFNGFNIDTDKWMDLYRTNYKIFIEARDDLVEYVNSSGIAKLIEFQKYLFVEEEGSSINWASSQQVIMLCKAIGIPTKILDKKKTREKEEDVFKDSVEERHLMKYEDKFPVIGKYLHYKRYEKAVKTYGKKFLEEHLHPINGRVSSSYRQILATGRLASRDPN